MTRKFESYDDYRRHLKNKYGLGEGSKYKPWFTVRDVKDKNAFRSIIEGIKTSRKHHFLSSIETQLFYILEFLDDVIDIREQFPLFPVSASKKIALNLGVEHPKVPKTGIDHVMSTDILVTRKNKDSYFYQAFCVKPEEKLKDLRTLEKLEIERIWWEQLGVKFYIFVGNKKTETISRNIAWATDPVRSGTQRNLNYLVEPAMELLGLGKSLKSEICDDFVNSFNISNEAALNLLRVLIATKQIKVDMSFLLEESLSIDIKYIEQQSSMACNGN